MSSQKERTEKVAMLSKKNIEKIAKTIIYELISYGTLCQPEVETEINNGKSYTEMIEEICEPYGNPFDFIFVQSINVKANDTITELYGIPEDELDYMGEVELDNHIYEVMVQKE